MTSCPNMKVFGSEFAPRELESCVRFKKEYGIMNRRPSPLSHRVRLRGACPSGVAPRSDPWTLQRFALSTASAAAFCAIGTAAYADDAKTVAVFGHLSALVGEWKGVGDTAGASLTYTLAADGSTLMEVSRSAKGASMVTMFSVDGDHLVATHYCSAGNQPQMATPPIVDAAARQLSFSLVRITGMKAPGDWHNTALEMRLEDSSHLSQRWQYSDRGIQGERTFRYERISP